MGRSARVNRAGEVNMRMEVSVTGKAIMQSKNTDPEYSFPCLCKSFSQDTKEAVSSYSVTNSRKGTRSSNDLQLFSSSP